MARLFTLNDLLKTAEHTEADFSAYLRGLLEWYPRVIDSLFKITYFIGELADPQSDRGAFEFFAFSLINNKHFIRFWLSMTLHILMQLYFFTASLRYLCSSATLTFIQTN